jgi:TolB-like protein/Flp pilus assembly protein TadD
MIGTTLAHYRILSKLGAGGMGEVYRANDTKLGRDVALKILPADMAGDPDRRARFRREAKALAALNHPNIVTIHSIEEHDGVHFLTMELVEGRTLGDLIPEDRGLDLERFLTLALPLVGAVSAAHEGGITHRDLKPANVMVATDGRLAVLDFGIAKAHGPTPPPDAAAATMTATQQGAVLGTTTYMSPEQLRGESIDHRSDVFSLGIILYEMATGRRPFGGASTAELASSILRDDPRTLGELNPDLPRSLDRIIRRCLAKEPERRFQSTIDLRNDLDELRADERAGASVAVLPFDDMSAEKDQDYFCEGIAEEIINALTKIRDLRVASRTASFSVRGVTSDIGEMGRRLGVETLLEGSVRKAGDRLRVTVQLVDAARGHQLWSERFDRQMEDVFAIQDEISQAVASALEVTLGPRGACLSVAPADMRAYEFYLRGRQFFHRFGPQNLEFARQMFLRAIEIDPTYAPAFAGLADTVSFRHMFVEIGDEASLEATRHEALTASRKALELAPDLAEAHCAHAYALSLVERYDESETHFERAIALDPDLYQTFYLYGRVCVLQGKLEKAAEVWERAMEIRPDDYTVPALIDAVYVGLADHVKRDASSTRTVEIIERHLELNPDDVRALYLGAGSLVLIGRRDEGLEWARRALEVSPDDAGVLYNVACVFAKVGHADDAVDLLERMGPRTHKTWMENDHDLDPIRDHPRFQAFMDSMG